MIRKSRRKPSVPDLAGWISLCMLIPAWTPHMDMLSRWSSPALAGLAAAVGLKPKERLRRAWLREQARREREAVGTKRLVRFVEPLHRRAPPSESRLEMKFVVDLRESSRHSFDRF